MNECIGGLRFQPARTNHSRFSATLPSQQPLQSPGNGLSDPHSRESATGGLGRTKRYWAVLDGDGIVTQVCHSSVS